MDTNQTSTSEQQTKQAAKPTQEEMLLVIFENTRKTMNYMKWQLYITIVLIVLPLLGMVVMLPLVLHSLGTLGSVYGPGGLISQ